MLSGNSAARSRPVTEEKAGTVKNRAAHAQEISRGTHGNEHTYPSRDIVGFSRSDGNLRRRVIYPTCDRLGVPRVSWHVFRHLHSSLLACLGIPVSVAQAQLGHADPRITLEIYTHMASGARRDTVERLERFLCSQVVPKLRVGPDLG